MWFIPSKIFLLSLLTLSFCDQQQTAQLTQAPPVQEEKPIVLGASRFSEYVPSLEGQRVGIVVNHTSFIDETHLVDTLLNQSVNIKKIFAPEHGFRGKVDRGETVANDVDSKTGLPLVSLYGRQKKPSQEMLNDIDVVIFDIQDVGARFYTYISTMHYVMEACAELGKKVIILDRPNPNGHYVDGPILKPEQRSFIGMHEIPIVHGLTVAELAQMINNEGWLANGIKCDIQIVTCENYFHGRDYTLPIKPSPNLPNQQSILLYPTLCLFEGTTMSLGRGTTFPFQVIGYPDSLFGSFTFTPTSLEGWEKNPKHKDVVCYGEDWREKKDGLAFNISKLIEIYQKFPNKDDFFISSFNRLAGNAVLKQQIIDGLTEEAIRMTWQEGLEAYKIKRKNYLLYPEE